MSKQVFINIPVSNVAKSTVFYEKLGFTKNPNFSDEKASSTMWSDAIVIMLLDKEFYKKFIGSKEIAETSTTNAVLIALTLESKEDVQKFADTAKENGGDYYRVDTGAPEDMMFGYEVIDIDGNQLEPVWMNPNFIPEGPEQTL